MLTIEAIERAHANVKSGADFPAFIQALKALGVLQYETNLANGKTIYHGTNGQILQTEGHFPPLNIHREGNLQQFKEALASHQQGHTDYPTFRAQAAEAGVEQWTTHLGDHTVTYFDSHNKPLVVEAIPGV
jgi:uncharacterized protein YbcV (DUF1398 family)